MPRFLKLFFVAMMTLISEVVSATIALTEPYPLVFSEAKQLNELTCGIDAHQLLANISVYKYVESDDKVGTIYCLADKKINGFPVRKKYRCEGDKLRWNCNLESTQFLIGDSKSKTLMYVSSFSDLGLNTIADVIANLNNFKEAKEEFNSKKSNTDVVECYVDLEKQPIQHYTVFCGGDSFYNLVKSCNGANCHWEYEKLGIEY